MSKFSGFDSEAVGFESVSVKKRPETSSGTQTNFTETGTGSQTSSSKECGSMTEYGPEENILKEYPPPGLNEFLRKVVPTMMEHLDQSETEFLYNSSDSDEEETLVAKLFQELEVKTEMPGLGAGDFQANVLSLSWSSAGNSLAVSIGQTQHETWCQHDGLIRVYTVKRSEQDHLVHALDITEKNCVSVVKYHPSVAALLAYGTATGEVVLCDLRGTETEGMQLSSPHGCHGSTRVSGLVWADATLANTFLMMQINRTGKRRGASDQILISSGSDGTINIWQVNTSLKIFENVICYNINGSKKMTPLDISCFDFIKTYPLRPPEEKVPDDVFVVGTKTGCLYLCKIKPQQLSDEVDPVYEALDRHSTCVVDVAFSFHKPGIFASISMDSELRVYDVNQSSPMKVLSLDMPISCMSWLPNNPCVVVLGLAKAEKDMLRVYNVSSGRAVAVDGLEGAGDVTAIAVNQSGTCRIAAGDSEGCVRVWDLPSRRIRLSPEDLEF